MAEQKNKGSRRWRKNMGMLALFAVLGAVTVWSAGVFFPETIRSTIGQTVLMQEQSEENTGSRMLQPDQEESRRVPIIMYHSVVSDPSLAGVYVVTTEELEQDLRWIRENGYETVVMEDLIRFVKGEASLPENPLVLTFDDGNYNNMYYVKPLLEKYEMKGVVSVVGTYADQAEQQVKESNNGLKTHQNPDYDYLSWEEIKMLSESQTIEIQNHSYELHSLGERKGSDRRKGESTADYICMLAEDLSRMQTALRERSDVQASTFVYPYGIISRESLAVVKALGFEASLSCYEKQNTLIRGREDCLYLLNRYNRPSGEDTAAFMERATGSS